MNEIDFEKKIRRRARETKAELDDSSASGIRKAGDTDQCHLDKITIQDLSVRNSTGVFF